MTAPVYARWAGRVLGGNPEERPPAATADRQRAILALERALVERGKRKSRVRWAMGLSVAASVVLCGTIAATVAGRSPKVAGFAGAKPTAAPSPQTSHEAPAPEPTAISIVGHVTGNGATIRGGPRTGGASLATSGSPDTPVVAGNRVVAHGMSHAILAFSTGTELSVEEEGDLTVLEQGKSQVFALDQGVMRAHVAKLREGERFVVHTPDAEVEVRGTTFRVSIAPGDPTCGAGSVTRVAVDEGVVVVRQGEVETRVSRGQSWPSCDSTPPVTSSEATPGDSVAAAATPEDAKGARASSARGASRSSSSLAAQNDAFAEALVLKNGGQSEAAVTAFERFTGRYPSSNLAESAAVERMKLLLATDHDRGVAAALQYLARYPAGFARADAKAAVAGVR
jgi:TolA-binding protein